MWDDELAATAQHWSDQCVPAHDRAAQRDVGRFPVGQNLAATWTTRPPTESTDSIPDFNKQINAWYDEVRIFGFKPITGGHGTGHYSQVSYQYRKLLISHGEKTKEEKTMRSNTFLHVFLTIY